MTPREIKNFLTTTRHNKIPDLYREGIFNEIAHEVQMYRKRLGLELTQVVNLSVSCEEYWVVTALNSVEAVEKLKQRCLVDNLYLPHPLLNSTENPFKLDNYEETALKIDIYENGKMTKDVLVPFGFSVN